MVEIHVYLLIFVCVTIGSFIMNYRLKRRGLYYLMNKLPGPKGLPLIGNGLEFATDNQEIINKIEYWNKLYRSPFKVWLGPEPMVAFTNPKDVAVLLSGVAGLSRAKTFSKIFRTFLGDGLLASDEIKWKHRRKLVVSTFHQKIIESFMPIFIKQTNILVDCLKKEVNMDCFDAWDYLSKVALDTLCGTAMGIQTNAQIQDCDYLNASKRILKLMTLRMLRVWLHPDIIFHFTTYGFEFRKCKKIMSSFTQKVIKEKQKIYNENKNGYKNNTNDHTFQKNPRKKAFLDYILELTENDPNFKFEDIEEEVNTLMIAGYDTSTITNSFILLAVAIHQDVQERICEELYSIFGNSNRPIEIADLQHMCYLEMVIKETLRMYPTVYVFFRQLTQNLKLDHCTVPKGASCCVAVKLIHNDPSLWPNPTIFNPDRFTPEEISKRHPYSYIPFGAGPRNCLGYKYAMMSMKVLLATVLRAYHVDTDLKSIELDLTNTLEAKNGWLIKIRNRTSLLK